MMNDSTKILATLGHVMPVKLSGVRITKRGDKIFLSGAGLAVGRIGRLGLTRDMGIEEGENRPIALAECTSEPVGFDNHGGYLGVLDRRG